MMPYTRGMNVAMSTHSSGCLSGTHRVAPLLRSGDTTTKWCYHGIGRGGGEGEGRGKIGK